MYSIVLEVAAELDPFAGVLSLSFPLPRHGIHSAQAFGLPSAPPPVFLTHLHPTQPQAEKLEVLFLSLIACLFCWNFANFLLLLLNRQLRAQSCVALSRRSAGRFWSLGLSPPLLLHIHSHFNCESCRSPYTRFTTLEWALYLPLIVLPVAIADFLEKYQPSKSILMASKFSGAYAAG